MAEKIEDLVIKLEMSVNDVNLVLSSLGNPIEPINSLIASIKQQGEQQLKEFQESEAVSDSE